METKVLTVDPRSLKLLEVNARFMEQKEFEKLVDNVKRDGCLTQLPFCCKDPVERKWLVLSGNHRVQAAIEAGLETIQVQATNKRLTKDEMLAIQLSHNAITGKDDMSILKELYSSIDDFEMKRYSGLNDDVLKILESVKTDGISSPSLEYQMINLIFLPSEVEGIKKALKEFKLEIEHNPSLTLHFKDYEKFMETLQEVGKASLVKNTALAFMLMVELAQHNIEQLKESWIVEAKPKDMVPISTILGRGDIKAEEARELDKALNLLVDKRVIKKSDKVSGLLELANYYLENEKKKKKRGGKIGEG